MSAGSGFQVSEIYEFRQNCPITTLDSDINCKTCNILSDAKSSDQKATIPYLLQELSADYDKQEEGQKKVLDFATHTGFHDSKIFIYGPSHQLSLENMEWLNSDDLGKY